MRRCLSIVAALSLAAACAAAWTVRPAGAAPERAALVTTTTSLGASSTSPLPTDQVTLTATVTTTGGGSPTGTVTFSDGGVTLGTANLATSGTDTSTATYSTTFPQGTHNVVATYSFSYPFKNSTSNTVVITSGSSASTSHATTVTNTTSSTTVAAGQPVQLTASVTDAVTNTAVTSGSVQFKDNNIAVGSPVGVSGSGVATLNWAGFAQGSHSITASYLGVANTYDDSGPSSSATITVNPTATPDTTSVTIAASPSTVQTGASISLTATVTDTTASAPATSGNVQFYDNGIPIGNSVGVNGSGVAGLTWTGFAAGSHSFTAKYLGNSTYGNSTSSSAGVTANAAPSAVATSITASISPNPIPNNGSATLTAHVQQVGSTVTPPQGSIVTFRNSANGSLIAQASLDANGNGTVVKSGWQAGHYDIVATYVGDATNQSSSAGFSADVRAVSQITVTAPSPSIVYGDTLPTLTPTYSGFTNGDSVSSLTTPATCTTRAATPAAVGSYAVSCSGASDTYYTFAYVPGTLAVAKAPLTLTPDNLTIRPGDPLPPLTATLSGFVNGEGLATSDVTGSPSCTTTATASSPVGTYPITCTLGSLASRNYSFAVGGQGTLTIATTGNVPVTAVPWVVALPVGQQATLYGSLYTTGRHPQGIPAETLTLSFGSQSCTGTTNTWGFASCQITVAGPVGPTTSVATFAGDLTYVPSTVTRPAYIYDFLGGRGSFVVGDESAFHSTDVTFWGAQWADSNGLSGGDAPNSFKGFASQPGTPQVGTSWSTGGGDSSSPPDGPLPSYMAVIVTGSAYKSGSSIGGSTDDIAVVAPDSGYAPNPGHGGTGTVAVIVNEYGMAVDSRGVPLPTTHHSGDGSGDTSGDSSSSSSSDGSPSPRRGHPWPGHAWSD